MSRSFLTMGDSNYFPSIALSAMQAEKYHPECSFGIYDWGFTKGERDFLMNLKNVCFVDWSDSFLERPFEESYPKNVCRILRGGSNWKVKTRMLYVYQCVLDLLRSGLKGKEWILAQKPYCFLDWASRPDVDKFIFLDGDAFLMSCVEELFENVFDLGVTIRRPNEISFTVNACQVINSGVVIFNSGENNKYVINAWIEQMQITNELLVEQTALTRLILGYDQQNGDRIRKAINLDLGHADIHVKLLDCNTYNYNWIEEGVDPSKNKIVHFKGGRHSGSRFIELANSLGLENDVRTVLQWHQS